MKKLLAKSYLAIVKWRKANRINRRLKYLRGEIEKEQISYDEIADLQCLGDSGHIPEDDLLLREWAGLPE